MIHFILNEKEVNTSLPNGSVLLDFIRYNQHLSGTKIGCREGDCGACTILIGELVNGQLKYHTATSCLTPLGNAHGKHIVTVEGINSKDLNPIQQALWEESATQCGFCTPGFIMSLAGFCLSDKPSTPENAIAAIDGNICRCTGYKSIERAASTIANLIHDKDNQNLITFVTDKHILPAYFNTIKERLTLLNKSIETPYISTGKPVGGGTDLYVQKHDEMPETEIMMMLSNPLLKGITQENGFCNIGASSTVTELAESLLLQQHFPQLSRYIKLVSSTPIRNIATVAGNLVNASPIGDLTIFFLALNATVILNENGHKREIPLQQFYSGYKKIEKNPNEIIEKIYFKLPSQNSFFSFEKVSKRTHLDIASVNTAIRLHLVDGIITEANISAGGVGPIPLFLSRTSAFFVGKKINEATILEAIEIAQTEATPISDARGTEAYKRLLLSQLIKTHFINLFKSLSVEVLLEA